MQAEAIIERARSLGISLSAVGDRIQYTPKSLAPKEFVDELREHKPEVLVHLRHQETECALETEGLLAWACELAEHDMVLPDPISYTEASLRTVTTTRISWYARQYLNTISFARLQQQTGGWGRWTGRWWKERESEALGALQALRVTMQKQDIRQNQP